MSAPDLKEIARRAVACSRWRWMDGMLYKQGSVGGRPIIATAPITTNGGLPDLSDPATMGCLLALVREAWGPTFHLIPQGGWLVQGARLPDGGTINLGICSTSEAEALVAALEAAP
jgi:hypothetical protein